MIAADIISSRTN